MLWRQKNRVVGAVVLVYRVRTSLRNSRWLIHYTAYVLLFSVFTFTFLFSLFLSFLSFTLLFPLLHISFFPVLSFHVFSLVPFSFILWIVFLSFFLFYFFLSRTGIIRTNVALATPPFQEGFPPAPRDSDRLLLQSHQLTSHQNVAKSIYHHGLDLQSYQRSNCDYDDLVGGVSIFWGAKCFLVGPSIVG